MSSDTLQDFFFEHPLFLYIMHHHHFELAIGRWDDIFWQFFDKHPQQTDVILCQMYQKKIMA
jgi:hypothetical protein